MKNRNGFALIIAIIIIAVMFVPIAMMASNAVSRSSNVSKEAVSDRALSIAEASVDRTLTTINLKAKEIASDPSVQTGLNNIAAYYTANPPDNSFEVQKVAAKYALGKLLSYINGGTIYQPQATEDPAYYLQADETTYPGIGNVMDRSVWDIEDNVVTWLYNVKTKRYYYVSDSDGHKIPVLHTGPYGDITTSYIKNTLNGQVKKGIKSWDPNYLKDNEWMEIDLNAMYTDNGNNKKGSTVFHIRSTAYLLSSSMDSHIARSILAEATLENFNVDTTGSSGSSTSGSTDVGPFHYAVWSGKQFILNGMHTIQSGHRDSSGKIIYDGKTGNGDVYADGKITINGFNRVYGNIATSLSKDDNGIITNGNLNTGKGHKFIYNHKETLPDFSDTTKDHVKTTAQTAGTINPGDYIYSNSSSTVNVNGGEVSYYIGGNASIMGWNNTIVFNSLNNVGGSSEPKVDWYINKDLNINGDVTLDFGDTPGIVWVNGDVTFNGNLNIKGSGTIVAGGKIILNGCSNLNNGNQKVMLMSEGNGFNGSIILNGWHNVNAMLYAPHGNIILNGGGNVFGSLVAGGYVESSPGVIINGNQNITYDTGIENSSSGDIPPIPAGWKVVIKGISFSSNVAYRLSWREIISDPVTNNNVENISPVPEFNYIPPDNGS